MTNINEKIQIGDAFNPSAALTLSNDELYKLSEEEIKNYFHFLLSEFDKNNDIEVIPEMNGRLISNGEEWE